MRSYSLHILKLTYFAPFILCIVCALVFQCKECIYITFDKLSFCGKCGVKFTDYEKNFRTIITSE